MKPEIRYEPGAHDGWDNYYFSHLGGEWRLLVIHDAMHPSSMLSLVSSTNRSNWTGTGIHSFPECITPETAMRIIELMRDRYDRGYKTGASNKLAQIREALEL